MFEYRYAVLGGVPSGTRGGFRFEGLCRRSRQAQVSRRDASARDWRTIRREAVRGNWKGEQSLCQNAVVSVQRQLKAIKPSVNGNKNNETKQTYQTQGVGVATQASVEKTGAASCGETLVVDRGLQDYRLATEALLVPQGSYQPFSLTQFPGQRLDS